MEIAGTSDGRSGADRGCRCWLMSIPAFLLPRCHNRFPTRDRPRKSQLSERQGFARRGAARLDLA
jgi:hypothetical protein